MSYKINCSEILNENMIVRVFLFFLFLLILFKYSNNKVIHKYLLLILIVGLFLSDTLDTIFPIFYIAPSISNEKFKYETCVFTSFYVIKDKIADLVSYVLIFLIFFKTDYLLLAFILYRAVGIILYLLTSNTNWFILFFDFIKEYLLYNYLFKTNKYIFVFIILKIIFEYFNYLIFNIRAYNNSLDTLKKKYY